MNYIDIKEAVKLTGKSDKTIRRLLSKEASKPFLNDVDGKLFINVNYLLSCYSAISEVKKETRQNLDTTEKSPLDVSMLELQNKVALYEQEIRHKDELLNEKNDRIMDLQRSLLLLEGPKDQSKKKKPWWKF